MARQDDGSILNKTEKPASLRYQELYCFCRPGELVFDFCARTSSIAEAVLIYGCNVLVAEKDRDQFDYISKRLWGIPAESTVPQEHYDNFLAKHDSSKEQDIPEEKVDDEMFKETVT